jgi:hypothetical protein
VCITFALLMTAAAAVVGTIRTRPGVRTRPEEIRVSILFLGYTNGYDGSRMARFRVTNQSTHAVKRDGIYFLESERVPFDPGRHDEFYGLSPFVGRVLHPGESETITTLVRTNQGAWRPILSLQWYGWRLRAREKVDPIKRHPLSWQRRIVHSLFPQQPQTIRGAWIDERENTAEPDAAPSDGPAPASGNSSTTDGRHR